jgi:hypothetical protein
MTNPNLHEDEIEILSKKIAYGIRQNQEDVKLIFEAPLYAVQI